MAVILEHALLAVKPGEEGERNIRGSYAATSHLARLDLALAA